MRAIRTDYRRAPIPEREKALLDYAVKLSRTPWAMSREDLEALRSHGFQDEDLSEAVQVIAYFNYINRVADALGVEKDPHLDREFPDV